MVARCFVELDLVQCWPITYDVKLTTTGTFTTSEEMATAISQSIESSAEFEGAGVKDALSVDVSYSLSQAWTETHSEEKEVKVSCTKNDDDTNFTGGCLWQMTMSITQSESAINWFTHTTECTASDAPPKCPPFEHVVDDHCEKQNASSSVSGVLAKNKSAPPQKLLRGAKP